MIDRRPALVVRCAGDEDVVAAVDFARDNELLVAVRGRTRRRRSGGLRRWSGHRPVGDARGRRRPGAAQGGRTGRLHVGDIDRATQRHGLAAPLGVVTETGVAGLTLSGAWAGSDVNTG
ncbi:hypothetical protein ACR6C2_27810 [Streptomyces sp. INA 01156]